MVVILVMDVSIYEYFYENFDGVKNHQVDMKLAHKKRKIIILFNFHCELDVRGYAFEITP